MNFSAVDLISVSLPPFIAVIGIYFKMNNMIIRQDVKISSLELEIKEMKRHNEKVEDKIFTTLEDIKDSVVDIKLHFSSCVNFKTNK